MITCNCRGLTFVELMISLALGVILTTASLQVFLTQQQILMMQQGIARLQENARVASFVLGELINSSGNVGCSAFREDVSLGISPGIDAQSFGLFPSQAICGVSLETIKNNPRVPKSVIQRIVSESDIVWIKKVKKHYPLVKSARFEDNIIYVNGWPHLKEDQLIAISDCRQADIVKVKQKPLRGEDSITKIILSHPLNRYYPVNSDIGIVESSLIYAADSGRMNGNGTPIYALYKSDLNGRTLELIEGVENLQVQYGILNNDTIIYLPQDKVIHWQEVIEVRIKLLLTSIEDGLLKPSPYYFNHKEIIPNDRIKRMWWTYILPIQARR